MTPSEAMEDSFCCPTSRDMPLYPPGLSISLCEKELEKLGLEYTDLCVDDMVHMHCMAVVISKSKSETQSGEDNERICLQITHIACEDEDEENEDEEEVKGKGRTGKLYKE